MSWAKCMEDNWKCIEDRWFLKGYNFQDALAYMQQNSEFDMSKKHRSSDALLEPKSLFRK